MNVIDHTWEYDCPKKMTFKTFLFKTKESLPLIFSFLFFLSLGGFLFKQQNPVGNIFGAVVIVVDFLHPLLIYQIFFRKT